MYTEKQLVAFGNYLFKRYNVQVFSNDGKNTPLYLREVHHANVCNWQDEEKQAGNTSLFNYGDTVTFMPGHGAYKAEVCGIHEYGDRHKYDLKILHLDKEFTRVYLVEEKMVGIFPPIPEGTRHG